MRRDVGARTFSLVTWRTLRLQPAHLALVAALALAAAGGCATVRTAHPGAVERSGLRAPAGERGLRAGAARVELTPRPGIPMGGYSRIGRVARGVWLPLYVRAVVLEDAEQDRLALVSADLWSIPRGLHERVVELLATDPDLRGALGHAAFGANEVVLAATHTHQSPAGYSTDRFFSSFAGPRAGFDAELFEFLARRIAHAIASAAVRMEPAAVYRTRVRIDGLVRNRSFEAFAANPEAGEILRANADLSRCEKGEGLPHDADEPERVASGTARRRGVDPRACRAVDAGVTMLRIERAGATPARSPVAVLAFLAAHPTVIHHRSPLYSSDVFGAVAARVERVLRARFGPADDSVVALFNGAEGDVSFRWTRQTRSALERLSERLAEPIARVAVETGAGEPIDGAIRSTFDVTSLAWRRVRDDHGRVHRTALVAMPGRATLAGAEDGRTDLWPWLWREGLRGPSVGPHGAKIGALDVVAVGGLVVPPLWFTRLLSPILAPERRVGVSVHRIGDLAFVTLPGEFTTVMGRRVRAAVARALSLDDESVVAIGLAQSYAYYFTTPEEYEHQHYEGASTLWGKYAGRFIAEHAERLARELAAGRIRAPARRSAYLAGMRRRFGLHRIETGADVYEPDLRFVLPEEDGARSAHDWPATYPRWCWDPATVAQGARPPAERAGAGAVRVDVSRGGAWQPADPDARMAGRLVLTASGVPPCWCAVWIPPREAARDLTYRFALGGLDAGAACTVAGRCSPAFHLSDPLNGTCPGGVDPGKRTSRPVRLTPASRWR